MGRQTRRAGGNKSRGKKNTPPQGTRQDRQAGGTDLLRNRSEEPLQAQHDRPDVNLGDSDEETGWRSAPIGRRRKAGR